MTRSMWVVAVLAASLSACGAGVARVQPAASGVADSVHQSRPGFADFPVWFSDPNSEFNLDRRTPDVVDDEFVPQPIALPDCPGEVSPHFTTPEAAMTYLASAWNRDDLGDLCNVTNPNARLLLLSMHDEAVNLRLNHCDRDGVGTYTCTFDHDYPKKMHRKGVGHTFLDVAAADNPGWYMTVYEGCG